MAYAKTSIVLPGTYMFGLCTCRDFVWKLAVSENKLQIL